MEQVYLPVKVRSAKGKFTPGMQNIHACEPDHTHFHIRSTSFTPSAIQAYPTASKNRPRAIFMGELGSLFFLPNCSQSHANAGANTTTKNELSDWNQDGGTL
jgi:hypothetical protein